MRRCDDGPGRRLARPSASLLALALLAGLLVACTGSAIKVDPPDAPSAVVSSADRIREGQTRLGGSSACLQDEFCAAGLTRVYGINLGGGSVELDTPTAIVEALTGGAIDIGALPSSSVETTNRQVTLLADDRDMEASDNIVPIVGPAALSVGGGHLAVAVDAISSALDQAGLVSIEQALASGVSPQLAAEAWLATHATSVPAPAAAGTIVLGARVDTESQALSDLYAGALGRAGWTTIVSPVGTGRSEELDALRLGHVGIVPDNTADLLEQLTGFAGVATSDLQHNIVLLRDQLADLGLVAFNPSSASPNTVFAVSRDVAVALSINSLTGLAHATSSRIPPLVQPAPLTLEDLAADNQGPPPAEPATLGVGSTGPAVVALQQSLAALGYDTAGATGTFDETTRRAVASFQADEDLISDGALDPATAVALAFATPGGHTSPAPAPGDADSLRPPPIASGPGSGPAGTIYLAFANGPSAVTPQVLDLLTRNGARATFFIDEDAATAYPQTVDQIALAGNAIGISTWPHNAASPIAEDALFRTVSQSEEAIAAVDGLTPTCLLAPYGATDASTRAEASSLGLKTVLWNVDPQDWRHPGASVIAADVIANAGPGSIVLLHDGGGDRSQTIVALETILPTLTTLGYRFAPLPGC